MGLGSRGPEDRSGLLHIPSLRPALPSQGRIEEYKPKAQDTAFPADAFHVSLRKCQQSQQASSLLTLLLCCFDPSAPEWSHSPQGAGVLGQILFLCPGHSSSSSSSFSLHSRVGLSDPVNLRHLGGSPIPGPIWDTGSLWSPCLSANIEEKDRAGPGICRHLEDINGQMSEWWH